MGMTGRPAEFVLGPCAVHGGMFAYDPDRVPVVLIDPATGRPPDVDEAGHRREPEPGAVERSVTRPYCPPCAVRLNSAARAMGLDANFDETDTAPEALGA